MASVLNETSLPVSLKFGRTGEFTCEMDSSRVSVLRPGPSARLDAASLIERALASPLDMPPFHQAVVPDDRVVIALDRDIPCVGEIIRAVWAHLEQAGVQAAAVTILQPAAVGSPRPVDPRQLLPAAVRQDVTWRIHDPTEPDACGYLATTAAGERVYLARELIDAGCVLPIGVTAYDPLMGRRTAGSVLYPGLSTVEAIRRTIGLGHDELPPHVMRPLRQITDEIVWLMGIPFVIQVIAAGDGLVDVIAGSSEGVSRQAGSQQDDHWLISMPERVDTVVAAIPGGTDSQGWNQLGQALATARQIVELGGRIILLSELNEAPGEGIEYLRRFEEPDEALQPLRQLMPTDLLPAVQLASAASRARVYLLSHLPSELVTDVFMHPLDSVKEVERLLQTGNSCAFLGGAQHTFGLVD